MHPYLYQWKIVTKCAYCVSVIIDIRKMGDGRDLFPGILAGGPEVVDLHILCAFNEDDVAVMSTTRRLEKSDISPQILCLARYQFL